MRSWKSICLCLLSLISPRAEEDPRSQDSILSGDFSALNLSFFSLGQEPSLCKPFQKLTEDYGWRPWMGKNL